MDKAQVTVNSLSEMNDFLLSPYKISLAVLIYEFSQLKSELTQKEIGSFCIAIMKLIQGFDLTYPQLLILLKKEIHLKKISFADLIKKKVNEMIDEGVSNVLNLITEIKMINWINRGSFLGIFLRRVFLYFDKLSFTGVMNLWEDFTKYVSKVENLEILINDDIQVLETSNCPKQLQNFINRQLCFLQVNEKKALLPEVLDSFIDQVEEQSKSNLAVTLADPVDFFKKNNSLNEINFLKYINALRVNEFVVSKHALFAYFDGISNYGSRCWPALNLAMFYYHFKHFDLSIESLKECVSSAQDSNDENCLEYALVWITKIIIYKRDKSYSDEDILAILHHLQIKATKLKLHNLASIASLHYEKLTGLQTKNNSASSYVQGNVLDADLVAVKNSLDDVLMMVYTCKSAQFYQIGACNLASLTSQALLHLHAVDQVGDDVVFHVNENTALALRNIACHLWKNLGEYEIAKDILLKLSKSYFSSHNNEAGPIWKSGLAEIEFEYYLFQNNWSKAFEAIETIKLFDLNEGKLKHAEFELRRGDKKKSMMIVNELLNDLNLDQSDFTSFLRIKVHLMKSKILDSVSSIFEPLDLAKQYHSKSLECLVLMELSYQLHKIGQLTQSLSIINNHMIYMLENFPQAEISKAYYMISLNMFHIYKREEETPSEFSEKIDDDEYLRKTIENNLNAIFISKKINEVEQLKLCYKLHAEIYNYLGDTKQRNHFAKELRQLLNNYAS